MSNTWMFEQTVGQESREGMESMASAEVVTQAPSQPRGGDQRRPITLGQLLQAMASMHHIDEVFLHLSQLITQRFDVQVVQVWATQVKQHGSFFVGLRSSVCQNRSLPERVVVNPYVAAVAEDTLRVQSASSLHPVKTIFPPAVATLLQRYGLHYHSSSFLSRNVLLPPAVAAVSAEQVPTRLAIAVLLFFRRVPHQNTLSSVSNMFQQILSTAQDRGFLLPAPVTMDSSAVPSTPPLERGAMSVLFELIPHRIENPAHNPLATSVSIADEQARRFYGAINGRRTVDELRMLTHLEKERVSAIVEMLLDQQRIALYEPGGQVVKGLLSEDR